MSRRSVLRVIAAATSAAFLIVSSSAFVQQTPPPQQSASIMSNRKPHQASISSLSASSVNDEQSLVTLKELPPPSPRRSTPTMSEAIPFLARPKVLTGELAGDVGFDPMGLAQNKEQLWAYREAEQKHGRLAMLAAAGWPISELLDRQLADYFGVPSILDDGDRVPSVLNGGLEKVVPEWWGFCLGMCAAIDLYGVQRARAAGTDSGYIPGDLGWRWFYPSDEAGRKRLQLAEIKHGRIAMLGVTGFAFQEYVSKLGVVDETPFFFYPLTRTISEMFQ